jgi:hypothetical protein
MTRARELSRLINANTLTVDTNNNIGIGSTTPTSKLNVVGVVSATTFSGNLTGTASLSTYATSSGVATYATTAGISTIAAISTSVIGGIASVTQLSVSGVSTLGITSTVDLRVSSLADSTTIVVGSAITLSYNTGGGNVAICSSPTGSITLNVIGIPTDSSFNNRSISFAVIVQQGATAYACTNITLNGVAFSAAMSAGLQTGISYSGGSVAVGNTTAYDVFNFTGINTVGSASTTLNYKILSNVSGNYRRY